MRPRRAREEPFSRWRSATASSRWSAHQIAPADSASRTTPATATSVVWISIGRARASSAVTHCLPEEDFRRFAEHVLLRLAGNRFLADIEDDRHRQRRNVAEPLMDDSPLDSRQHIAQSPDVEEAGG